MFLIPLRETKIRISESDCCQYTAVKRRLFTINKNGKKNGKPPKLNSINYSQ